MRVLIEEEEKIKVNILLNYLIKKIFTINLLRLYNKPALVFI